MALAECLQPVSVSVPTAMYVPAWITVIDVPDAPVFQVYTTLVCIGDTVSVTGVPSHGFGGAKTENAGETASITPNGAEVAEQPFASVTTTE